MKWQILKILKIYGNTINLLSNKSQRGKLETIQLLMKNGTYLNCLVNMYYGNNNHIICRYQAFSSSEMNEYETYSALLTNYASHLSQDETDTSDLQQMSPVEPYSNDYSESDQSNVQRKRLLDDEDYSNDETEFQSSSDDSDGSQFNQDVTKSNKKIVKKRKLLKIEPTQVNPNTYYIVPAHVQQEQQQQLNYQSYNNYQFSPISDEILRNLEGELTQNIFFFDTDSLLADTAWDKINVNDLIPYTSADDVILSNEDSNGQQFNFDMNKKYCEKNIGFNNQDEFLDQLISMIDDSERGQ